MSMSPGAVLASGNQSGFAGTDIIQLSDIAASNNRIQIPINGAKTLYLDNRSGAQLLIIVDYPSGTGNLQVVLEPWDTCPLVFDTEIDSIELVNLSGGPVPIGYSTIARIPTLSGYVIISVVADASVIQKESTYDPSSPAWYRSTGKISVPAGNGAFWLIGGPGGIYIDLNTVTVLDLWNFDGSNDIGFRWWTGPQAISTGATPLVFPTGGTVDSSNPDIYVPAGGALSMDIDTRNRGLLRLQANNGANASPVIVQALARGF